MTVSAAAISAPPCQRGCEVQRSRRVSREGWATQASQAIWPPAASLAGGGTVDVGWASAWGWRRGPGDGRLGARLPLSRGSQGQGVGWIAHSAAARSSPAELGDVETRGAQLVGPGSATRRSWQPWLRQCKHPLGPLPPAELYRPSHPTQAEVSCFAQSFQPAPRAIRDFCEGQGWAARRISPAARAGREPSSCRQQATGAMRGTAAEMAGIRYSLTTTTARRSPSTKSKRHILQSSWICVRQTRKYPVWSRTTHRTRPMQKAACLALSEQAQRATLPQVPRSAGARQRPAQHSHRPEWHCKRGNTYNRHTPPIPS